MTTDRSFREDIASDLRQLADILDREGLVTDTGPLRAAQADCRQGAPGKWDYRVERLLFRNLGKGLEVIPSYIEEHDLAIEFSFRAKGRATNLAGANPFDYLHFDILIYADFVHPTNTEILKASCAWHLDFHVTDNHNNAPAFSHPTYHFQHGGQLIKEHKETVGPILVVDSPRLAHPPMDAILGVDFVLTNFIESPRLIKLRADAQYRNVLKRSQERLWKPYFHSLASVWSGVPDKHWEPSELLPQLVV